MPLLGHPGLDPVQLLLPQSPFEEQGEFGRPEAHMPVWQLSLQQSVLLTHAALVERHAQVRPAPQNWHS